MKIKIWVATLALMGSVLHTPSVLAVDSESLKDILDTSSKKKGSSNRGWVFHKRYKR